MKKSDTAKALKIDISGVRHLVLRVSGGGEGQGPLADCLNPTVAGKKQLQSTQTISYHTRVKAFSLTNRLRERKVGGLSKSSTARNDAS